MEEILLDTHYHLGFIEDSQMRHDFLSDLDAVGIKVIGQTVTPSEYLRLNQEVKSNSNTKQNFLNLSLGFHPWWITSQEQSRAELAVFETLVGQTRFIGEIGLDFSPRRLAQADAALQIEVFRRIITMVMHHVQTTHPENPYVLSIHTVRSVDNVLDILEGLQIFACPILPILHRFNGTSDQLTRHIKNGGYLSIHPEMLERKKGRAYLRQIPADRLLLETDLPLSTIQATSEENNRKVVKDLVSDLDRSLHEAISAISEIRGEDVFPIILETQKRLYGL